MELNGYQVNFQQLEAGLFLFNHIAPECGTTLALAAGEFADLYTGPIWKERLTGAGDCPRYCLRKSELRPCPAECECAYVRSILDQIRHWPRKQPRQVVRHSEGHG